MKKLFFILLIALPLYSQVDCSKYTENYIPVDLNDAMNKLNCNWSDEYKNAFKNKSEEEATSDEHFGYGLEIRNSWGLWKGENELVKYFVQNGISHPDDISSIILTSFHRKLNNVVIDLNSQIKYYQDYWAPYKAARERSLQAYNEYEIGDTITIYYQRDENFMSTPIDEWTFDPNNDIKIKGKIVSKKMLGHNVEAIFNIEIISFNKNYDLIIQSERYEIGDIIEISLDFLKYDRN